VLTRLLILSDSRANTVLPTFSIGILGPGLFGLGLGESVLYIVFINLVVAMIPAYFSVFGVRTGLRQMVVSRYMWGWWGGKVVSLLNVIACVGWSTINCIAGAQTLRVVANLHLSPAVGIVIIALITLVLGVVGYRQVHLYDRVAWIPVAIVFLIFLGLTAKDFVGSPIGTGITHTGNALSFCSTIWGFGLGWASLASDYVVYMPADTPSWTVFGWAYAGLTFVSSPPPRREPISLGYSSLSSSL
jgi:purine-cytosine permease-like protein